MRILVISDSHGSTLAIDKAISAQPLAKHIFFLGDKLSDIEDFDILYPDRIFHTVSGNCDFYSQTPSHDMTEVAGKRIFFTHGHEYGVKSGTSHLLSYGRALGSDIILYGHTHIADTEYANGIYSVNPGSIGNSRGGKNSYAFIDIEKNGIIPVIVNALL